ncbi:MAG: histone deacetylase family protein [Firmicutes bacterium]|nr:histone deacetylase family protein [Bacillota bacterium]
MKVIFHERFREVYDTDPAAAQGRLDGIVDELRGHFEFVEPKAADESDILLVHSQPHLERVKNKGLLYEIAALSAGGAIQAAELAVQGEPAFALIRPPGHHASRDSCWGFCWFNNVALAVEKLLRGGVVNRVLIVDIDLHYGDGTNNIFSGTPGVVYYHLDSLHDLERCLIRNTDCDLIAVSAGFDMHVNDWGGLLLTEDYTTIGEMIASHARRVCNGKFFAAMEGGYNHRVLGKNVKALLEGFGRY